MAEVFIGSQKDGGEAWPQSVMLISRLNADLKRGQSCEWAECALFVSSSTLSELQLEHRCCEGSVLSVQSLDSCCWEQNEQIGVGEEQEEV